MNVQRLVQLLGMLGSSHDGEALAAARKVEAERKKIGAEWDKLVDGAATAQLAQQNEIIDGLRKHIVELTATLQQTEVFVEELLKRQQKANGAKPPPDDFDVILACDYVLGRDGLPDGIYAFAESIKKNFRLYGTLTDKQRTSIERTYYRVKRDAEKEF